LREEIEKVNDSKSPAGCSIEMNNKNGKVVARFNTNEGSTKEAGRVVDKKGGSFSNWGGDKSTVTLCAHDRTLSASAASYYSPYKLKQSMVQRTQMSTTCSFGMYADLARRKQTKSSCAAILTARTLKRYRQASDAIKKAKFYKRAGQDAKAAKVIDYVEKIRAKYMLIDIIANHWCPDNWNEALKTTKDTCLIPRVPDESKEDEETMERLFKSGGRQDKIAFEDDFCKGVSDETLASRLPEKWDDAPADFFKAANI